MPGITAACRWLVGATGGVTEGYGRVEDGGLREGCGRGWRIVGVPMGATTYVYTSVITTNRNTKFTLVLRPVTRSRRPLPSYDYQVSLARLEPVTRGKPE